MGDYFYVDGIVSDQNTKHFSFSQINGYDNNGSHVVTFRQYDDSSLIPLYHEGEFAEMSGFRCIVNFWYVDRDVTINGRFEGQGYDLNLKMGWNIVYEQSFEPSGTSNYSTTAPADCNVKWLYHR